jgi:hypothetical protein
VSVEALIIRSPETRAEADTLTFSSRVETPAGSYDMWFRGPREVVRPQGADAFLITCLPTAMKLGLPVVVEASTSPRLLEALDTIQDILDKWHPDFRRIRVDAPAAPPACPPPRGGVAAFFSGGVDSFYTALKHRDALSALVLVHGFDMPLENTELRARVAAATRKAAAALGKPLVEIETNSKPFTDRHVDWAEHQFGPALAGVAVLGAGVAGQILIPSSETYAHLDPHGSHPILDPLWSTDYMALVHDGAEANRTEKVAAIASFPPALELLRVCWENPDNAYNCGRCEKCIRTMLNLEAAGALERCTAFDVPLAPEGVAEVWIPMDAVAYHFEDNLSTLRARGADPALLRAMEQALTRFEAEKLAGAIAAMPARPLLQAMARRTLRTPARLIRHHLKRLSR